MPGKHGQLETGVTLILADQAPKLAQAHDELYPQRVSEGIPLSLTLLYPFVPHERLADRHFKLLREFFAGVTPFEFELTHVAEGSVMYAVPEPDENLRAMMRALWSLFPYCPPYGRPGNEPPPHTTLAELEHGSDTHRRAMINRVEGLLPAGFVVREATLMEEHEPDRWRLRTTFPLAG